MSTVTVRELRNNGAEVIRRAEHGEPLVVTRDGEPVIALSALPRAGRRAEELVASRQQLPVVDPSRMRADMDELLDPAL